jgi:hypothetical protein
MNGAARQYHECVARNEVCVASVNIGENLWINPK